MEHDLLLTLLLFLFGTIFFLFFMFYVYLTLGNKNIRTLITMSLPMFRKGRVLDIHLKRNRTVNFQLLSIEKNRLTEYTIKDGKDVIRNKDIEPGICSTSSSESYQSPTIPLAS